MKTNLLMLYKKIITIYSEYYTKHNGVSLMSKKL